SLTLASPAVVGQTYRLQFAAESDNQLSTILGIIEIGISTSATAFGTQIFSANPAAGDWTLYDQTFIAPISGQYLTVSSDPNHAGWTHVDNFQLELVPEPAGWAILGLVAALLAWRRKFPSLRVRNR